MLLHLSHRTMTSAFEAKGRMGYRDFSHAGVSQPKMLKLLIFRTALSFATRRSW